MEKPNNTFLLPSAKKPFVSACCVNMLEVHDDGRRATVASSHVQVIASCVPPMARFLSSTYIDNLEVIASHFRSTYFSLKVIVVRRGYLGLANVGLNEMYYRRDRYIGSVGTTDREVVSSNPCTTKLPLLGPRARPLTLNCPVV